MSDHEFLTVEDALSRVLNGVGVMPEEQAPLAEALGRVLAAPVKAQDSLPPFANSSMDGYALLASDTSQASKEKPVQLRVTADIAAGTMPTIEILPGSAMRIMTGAPLPTGADAVIPVEDTSEPWRDLERPLPDLVLIKRAVKSGDYVRHIGEDIVAGQIVMDAGHVLRPQEIGVLASLGMSQVSIIRKPRIGILSTGDELVDINEPLGPGKIRNSNSYAQEAQVRSLGAQLVSLGVAADTEADVREKLDAGFKTGIDLFVSSAGVSVGAYDVVKAVLEKEGNVGFWRVRMRPGKPLAFGTYRGIPYLGLPGNPVSAMVSFERFVRPAILKMAGHTDLARPRIKVIFKESIYSDGRESYVRAVVTKKNNSYQAVSTGSQGSHIMTSLVKANALVIIPEGIKEVTPGMELDALMLNWPETVF